MSEPKKTGSTITSVRSDHSLQTAEERTQLWAVKTLLWLQRPQKCSRRQRGTGEESKHNSWRASSTKAASSFHLHTSASHPVPGTVHCQCRTRCLLHCTGTHFFSSPTTPASSSKHPTGGSRPPTLLQIQLGGKQSSLWAELHQQTQTLSPPAAPASRILRKCVILNLKENIKHWENCASLKNSLQKEWEREADSHHGYF